MGHKIVLILVTVFCLSGYAQSVEKIIILKDKDTNATIEDASVSILKTKQNLLSNANGVVTFELNGVSSIQIKHPSYLTVTIRSLR